MHAAAAEALEDAANELLQVANQTVPKEEGILEGSGDVSVDAAALKAQVSYGGEADAYAVQAARGHDAHPRRRPPRQVARDGGQGERRPARLHHLGRRQGAARMISRALAKYLDAHGLAAYRRRRRRRLLPRAPAGRTGRGRPDLLDRRQPAAGAATRGYDEPTVQLMLRGAPGDPRRRSVAPVAPTAPSRACAT